jgi:hypothetical protein
LKVGPPACCSHFGDRGRYSFPNVRNAIEGLDPAFSQKFFDAVIERRNALRGSPVGQNSEGVVLLRREKIGRFTQPRGHKFIHRKSRRNSLNGRRHGLTPLWFLRRVNRRTSRGFTRK